MAEAFARTYGSDVIIPRSAGLFPAVGLAPFTRKVMAEKNIDLGDVLPKSIGDHGSDPFDLIINISGLPLPPEVKASVREWKVKDPIGGKEQQYREAADQIEGLVMELVKELRGLQQEWTSEFDTRTSGHAK
jgi:protein-tyrosine-phosphatase